MKTIHAIYENGVFRPTEPVDLPEGAAVVVAASQAVPDTVQVARQRVFATLAHSYVGGEPDAAERHNEHQP
jgi:predicted DNA-binding antitoxin AbrB/MazE fold protein